MANATEPTGPQHITADMKVDDVLTRYPQTGHVFFRYKLACSGCYISRFHDIATGAKQFNIDLDKLLAELNEAANELRG